jgi:ferredoxin
MQPASGYEIRVDRDLCMGSAQCSIYAPNTFGQDEDAVAVVLDACGDSGEAIQAAIDSCPTRALSRS